MEKEDSTSSKSGSSYGSEEDSSYDEDDDMEMMDAFEASSEGSNNEPKLGRMTSTQIGRNYSYQIINPDRLFSMIQTAIIAVKSSFEYLNLDEGYIISCLKENNFLVDQTVQEIQDKVMVLMEKQDKKTTGMEESELICLIDYMPMEKHQGKDVGCGHMVCNECWAYYIEQKIGEGMDCIKAKCPIEGCDRGIPITFFEEYAKKGKSDL